MAKIAVVTGAGGGMGLATVRRLSQEGYRIAAIDLNTDELAQFVKDENIDALVRKVDASNEDQCRAAVADIHKEYGRIDVFVNLIGWTDSSRFVEEDSAY